MIVNKTKLVNTGKVLVYEAATSVVDSPTKLFMSDFVGYNKPDVITGVIVKACSNLDTLDNLLIEDEDVSSPPGNANANAETNNPTN